MNINIHIDVSKLVATLAEVNDRSKNLEPVMEEISMQMLSQTQMRFRRSQDPDGNAWKPLAKSTIRQRKKKSSKPLMNTTTHIYQKLTKRSYKNSASVGLYDSENAKIGAVHNFGTTISRNPRSGMISWRSSGGRRLIGKGLKSQRKGFTESTKTITRNGIQITHSRTRHEFKAYTITIPQRQFLGFSQKEIVKYNKMIQRYITKGEL